MYTVKVPDQKEEIKQGGKDGRLGLMLVVICSLFSINPGVLFIGHKPFYRTQENLGV